jgi:hypothetical protein
MGGGRCRTVLVTYLEPLRYLVEGIHREELQLKPYGAGWLCLVTKVVAYLWGPNISPADMIYRE